VWGDACCIIPWNLYRFYGDTDILRRQYPAMKAWVDYVTRLDGTDHSWLRHFHYGDWLALDNHEGGAEQVRGATDEGGAPAKDIGELSDKREENQENE